MTDNKWAEEILTCKQAVEEIRAKTGLRSYGMVVGALIARLDKCPGGLLCKGQPRAAVVAAALGGLTQDVVLALRN